MVNHSALANFMAQKSDKNELCQSVFEGIRIIKIIRICIEDLI